MLSTPGDTSVQRLLSESAAREAQETEAEAARLAGTIGIQVPANEVLFFPTLPLRVDSVRVRRGDTAAGNVMTVSNSRLAIDSSLSLNDAKLVRPGARVTIEEPDLGVRATGAVTQVADRPGTHKVDPARVYLEVAPGTAPAQLVGASVKLTIAVKSTQEAVLTVPVNALSVGADGSTRVQREGAGGRTEYVEVEPGLAAHGLVEVRPVSDRLAADDLVIVGASGAGHRRERRWALTLSQAPSRSRCTPRLPNRCCTRARAGPLSSYAESDALTAAIRPLRRFAVSI